MFRFLLVVTAIMGMAFLLGCQDEPIPDPIVETVAATAVAQAQPLPTIVPTIPPSPAATIAAPASPTPVATVTPSPTLAATDTPVPTDTAVPTDTPTATATPFPTQPPTDTPTPVPTADTFGLSANFLVEDGSVFAVNQDIWFQFDVKNPNGIEIKYGALGLYPHKDGVDRLDLFQYSWTNATMFADGLVWRDHISIPEPGQYTVRIAICFEETKGACQSPAARWATLSAIEIPITVQ